MVEHVEGSDRRKQAPCLAFNTCHCLANEWQDCLSLNAQLLKAAEGHNWTAQDYPRVDAVYNLATCVHENDMQMRFITFLTMD